MRYGRRVNGMGWEPPASAAVRGSRSSLNPFTRLLSFGQTALVRAIEEIMRRIVRVFVTTFVATLAAACASTGGGGGTVTSGGAGPEANQTGQPNIVWPIKTREHVDLWLHGFAMLQEDTTFVPFFRRGYSTDLIGLKTRANVVT